MGKKLQDAFFWSYFFCLFDSVSENELQSLWFENAVKVGIPEFLNGVGRGLGNHVEKLESEIGDLNKLLVTRTIKLKRLGIPCKDVREISLFVYVF